MIIVRGAIFNGFSRDLMYRWMKDFLAKGGQNLLKFTKIGLSSFPSSYVSETPHPINIIQKLKNIKNFEIFTNIKLNGKYFRKNEI